MIFQEWDHRKSFRTITKHYHNKIILLCNKMQVSYIKEETIWTQVLKMQRDMAIIDQFS
jgi:hypothetical protein